MPGSILCQQWYDLITRPGLATSRNKRPVWPLQKVWTGSQRHQVTHNDMPDRHIMGGDFGGGHRDEVHRVGRLVRGEAPKADSMPGV